MRTLTCTLLIATAVVAATPVLATQPAETHGPVTGNLQGGDQAAALRANPYFRELYGVSVVALAYGPDKVNLPDFEARFFAVARKMAAETGGDPAALQDHLKLIPGQIVRIVRDDPKALDSFDRFVLAMVGPP
jgi:hypothetical protein